MKVIIFARPVVSLADCTVAIGCTHRIIDDLLIRLIFAGLLSLRSTGIPLATEMHHYSVQIELHLTKNWISQVAF